jgi:hypothetical protein
LSLSLGWLGVHAIHAHSLAWSSPFSYHSRAMLSRAQEARVRDVLASHPPGTIQTYCLEHLAAAVKIPPAHLADLAAFVRNLREHGACQTQYGASVTPTRTRRTGC